MIVRAVILNYNSAEFTLTSVSYILKQKTSCTLEIVVVDNGSSRSDCEQLRADLPSDVKFISLEKNLGFAAGNNRGCGSIDGLRDADYYIMVNSDAYLIDDTTIDKLLTALVSDPDAVAASPLIHTLSNTIPVREQIQVRRVIDPFSLVLCHSPIARRFPYVRNRFYRFIYRDLVPYEKAVYPVDTINGAVFMVKSDFLHGIGLLDEGTFLYGEELVLGEQIKKSGKRCLLHGEVIAEHIQGASSGSRKRLPSRWTHEHFIKSEAHLLRKYHNIPESSINLLRYARLVEFKIKSLLYK